MGILKQAELPSDILEVDAEECSTSGDHLGMSCYQTCHVSLPF